MILIFKQKKISLDKVWLICAYNTGQKFGPIFNVFERNVLCSSSLHLFDQNKKINNNNQQGCVK